METDIVKVREKLANDLLLRLGDEMIDVELTPHQLQKCIDLALAKLRQRSDAFVEEALVLLTLKNRYDLKLSGLYSVDIYINDNIGAFIYIKKSDTFIQYKDIDLKIKIFRDSIFYFKTADFEIVKNKNNIYYYNEYYYIDINEFDNLIKYIEMGELVHSENFNINEGTKIK